MQTVTAHQAWINDVAVSSDAETIYAVSSDATLSMWEPIRMVQSGRLQAHTKPARAVAIMRNGTHFVTGGADQTIRIWETESRRTVSVLANHDDWVQSLAISADDGGRPRKILRGHEGWVRCVTVSPNGDAILSGGLDEVVHYWRCPSGRLRGTLTGHSHSVEGVVFLPGGTSAVSASLDKTLIKWDLTTLEPVQVWEGHQSGVRDLVLLRSHGYIASISADCTVGLWRISDGSLLHTIQLPNPPICLAAAPNDSWLVVGDEAGQLHRIQI